MAPNHPFFLWLWLLLLVPCRPLQAESTFNMPLRSLYLIYKRTLDLSGMQPCYFAPHYLALAEKKKTGSKV